MKNKTLTVEAAAAKDPTKYLWFKLNKAKAKFNMHHKTHDLELERDGKFGLKLFKDKYFLLPGADLTTQFALSEAEAKKLVKSSTPFRGQVAKKKVSAGSWEELQPKAKKVKEPKAPKEPKEQEQLIDGASLRDTPGRKALDANTLPKELLTPSAYKSSWYGRVLKKGRNHASDYISVGFAMAKGKYALIVVTRDVGKDSYSSFPESKLTTSMLAGYEQAGYEQVDFDTFLKIRKLAYSAYHSNEDGRKERVEKQANVIIDMKLRVGQQVSIQFDNARVQREILGIDVPGGRIQIRGGGRASRWVRADMVVEIVK